MKKNEIKRIPLIIDTDPGTDDSVALLILAQNIQNFDLKLICSTAGNTPIEKTTTNCQFFAKNFFPGVKVAKGVSKALVHNLAPNAEFVHGETGMGDYNPGKQDYPYEEDSAVAMYEVLNNSTEPVTLVTLGPMTNIARLLIMYPNIKSKIKEIYAMIGSINGHGNVTKYAEFNSYFDPEAFQIVAKSGIRIIFNSIELGEMAKFPKTELQNITPKNEKEQMILEILNGMHEINDPDSLFLYDANSVMALTEPKLYNLIPCDVEVSTQKDTYGQCFMTPNKKGLHCYQEIKNIQDIVDYITNQLFG